MESIDGECPYIPDLQARTERAILADGDELGIELLLKNGYRHFGRFIFRPVCGDCGRCVPVRIPLDRFTPGRNHRRSQRRLFHEGFSFSLGEPVPDRELFRIYREHKLRFSYPEEPEGEDLQLFSDSFFSPTPGSKVLMLGKGSLVIAAGHLDIVGKTLSAVYTYWDPRYAPVSPGKNMILQEIEIARELGLKWLCLGYLVRENPSMRYKEEYYPLEYSPRPGIWEPWLNRKGELEPNAPESPRFILV